MRVFKFGGASVKDAAGIKNLANIVKQYKGSLVVVVSAMGKTTNAMERIATSYFEGNAVELKSSCKALRSYHQDILLDLFGDTKLSAVEDLFNQLSQRLQLEPSLNFDFEYDQIVPFGELLSTTIVSAYLNTIELSNKWVDIRRVLKTDDCYRSANVDWALTQDSMLAKFKDEANALYVTQGFIASTVNNLTTTLGREGSDYTGAIIAYAVNAESLAIWKDVAGVLNADPRWYPQAQKIEELSYWEAIELSYYGAQVIHPKTLKPLQNKQIPLLVNSFIEPEKKGTIIQASEQAGELQPIYVLKRNQVLLSMSPKDFSFIIEESLSDIFQVFSKHRISINMMQTSALNFSVCVDDTKRVNAAIDALGGQFDVRYNENMELLTIRHYDDDSIKRIIQGKELVDSQVSRKTARYVLKASPWNF